MIMSLSVKNQSVESSGITKDYKEAICEYIWNGFEANATEVRISYNSNCADGIDSIIITDNGEGIDFDALPNTFGAFLASQKNSLSLKVKSKANKGKGRFSFSAFSTIAEFHTRYKSNDKIKSYKITLSNDNKETFEYEEPQDIQVESGTGTTVIFYNLYGIYADSLTVETFEDYLLCEFAWYLYLNKHKKVKLFLNDVKLDYNKHINTQLSETITRNINGNLFEISLIVWSEKIKEKFRSYYFDSNNSIKGIDTTTFNRNTVDFNHSVFIQSSFFNKWDEVSLFDFSDQISLNEPEDRQKTLKNLKKEIQEFIETKLRLYMSAKADKEVDKMIKVRKTFPVFSEDDYGELRRKDLVRVTKEIYCLEPRIFHKLKEIQEKSLLAFLNLLLSSEERENVLTIIDEIVQLTTEQRNRFANILRKTHLENIIDTISFIEERYRIIEILKSIIYDLDKFANERNHIQKIIEQNYWLFGEQYHLTSADKTMHHALEQYNYYLYGAKNATEALTPEAEAERRMDIFLSGARNVETSFGSFIEENIVVELKAPHVTLSKTVLRQIEDYMDYIRTKPQFNSQQRQWKFIAVCKEVDDYVKDLYNTFKERGKPGLVHQSNKYELYALTWDDVFKNFDIRHSFMLKKLRYDRDILLSEMKTKYDETNRETVDALTQLAVNNKYID